uniref:Putative proteasome subunit beta type 1 n=1 Tax=Taeniopygia guttata TaxID=59729 RepID=B5G4R6_TAEGU|nr:putative proteasome subunit beta type 1 [Taeniopygia guttata]
MLSTRGMRALPARGGLRAGGARAAPPLLAVHLQRRDCVGDCWRRLLHRGL